MGLFSAILERSNGQKVDRTWFEAIAAAGEAVEAFLGSFTGLTSVSIANNQAASADVTGCLMVSSTYLAAIVDYQLRRKTTLGEAVVSGQLRPVYRQLTSAWDLPPATEGGDESGVTFGITSAGQVQYVSDSMAGSSYSGYVRFSVRTL